MHLILSVKKLMKKKKFFYPLFQLNIYSLVDKQNSNAYYNKLIRHVKCSGAPFFLHNHI